MNRDTMVAAYRRLKFNLEGQIAPKGEDLSAPGHELITYSEINSTLSDLTGKSSSTSMLGRDKSGRPVGMAKRKRCWQS